TIVIAAPQASYDTARRTRGWTLSKGTLHYLLGPGRETAFRFDRLSTRDMREAPVDLLAEPKAPDEMRYAELGRYSDALARSGSATKKLRVERGLKLYGPFPLIIIPVSVRRGHGLLERLGNQLTAAGRQSVRRRTSGVDPRGDQRLGRDEALSDAPVVVEQVGDVQDVEPDLEPVGAARDAPADVLRETHVGPIDHRQEDGVALRVRTAA